MILLAPRRVQEAFTNTNTTRKLESHGLLDDKARITEKEKARRQKQRERGKRKEREKEKLPKKTNEDAKSKGKERRQAQDDSQIAINAERSVTYASSISPQTLSPPPASAPSFHSSASLLSSPVSQETSFTDHTVSRTSSLRSRRRHRVRDPLYDDDDDEAPPTRTPHSETYGTMDASTIEQLKPRQGRSHVMDSDSNANFFKRLLIRGRGTHTIPGSSPGQPEPPFVPRWLTLAPRNQQELQQRVVDNLNTSFKDVGLLPSTHKDKPKPITAMSQKPKKISTGSRDAVDIFKDIPADSLFMLLPLWPGETDPTSELEMGAYEKPHIPNEQRQFLLVNYKVFNEGAGEERRKSRGEGESKKRSRNSPTSSHELNAKKEDRASILLSSFHISARLVSCKNLQGSGVRVPDEGLTITGPLNVAFDTMPVGIRDEGLYEWVLGVCHSREAGVEFYPDGLVKMGLCKQTGDPVEILQYPEEFEPPEPDVELTPIGRAVLEMVWLGALALTSFGPGT